MSYARNKKHLIISFYQYKIGLQADSRDCSILLDLDYGAYSFHAAPLQIFQDFRIVQNTKPDLSIPVPTVRLVFHNCTIMSRQFSAFQKGNVTNLFS